MRGDCERNQIAERLGIVERVGERSLLVMSAGLYVAAQGKSEVFLTIIIFLLLTTRITGS